MYVGFSVRPCLGLPCFCQMLALEFAPICRFKKQERLERKLVLKVCFLGRSDSCPFGGVRDEKGVLYHGDSVGSCFEE